RPDDPDRRPRGSGPRRPRRAQIADGDRGRAPRAGAASPAPGRTRMSRLADIARQAMIDRGLEPDFPQPAVRQVAAIDAPAPTAPDVRDLRALLWASIDNDDSRDLDQLSVADALPN